MKAPGNGYLANSVEGETKAINSELWHACAGPLVSLPPVGSLVVYFPQGHSEQVAASMQKQTDGVPSYPNLPSKLICMLHNVTLHADPETDEVYAQMTLQPVNKYNQEAVLLSDMGLKQSRQPAEFFCKTLTASDTSTHGGFSVPRRAAEKIFPPLDFSMQPPAQELTAKDLHDQTWTFKHIYRGQPKRHLLTTGWSVFVSSKRLMAGDSVLFIRDEKSRFLLGIRRASRQPTPLSSSVISSDSMHIGILAAGAHAAANNSPFTIFYNPRASPSEFVIPLAKYNKAMYTPVSLGMRFRMMFETEESGVRRYMGTITSISDLDPVRWKGSQWRNLQVGWDESTAGERPSRVSIWEIEPVVTPFYICPPPFFGPKFSKRQGYPDEESDVESLYKRGIPWMGDEFGQKDPTNSVFPGLSLVQWMNMQQNNMLPSGMHSSAVNSGYSNAEDHTKLLNFQSPTFPAPNFQFGKVNQQNHQVNNNHLQQSSLFAHQQQSLQASVNSQQQQPPQVSKPPPQQPLLQQCPPHIPQQQKQHAGASSNRQIPNQKLQSPCNPQPSQNITSGINGVSPSTSVQQNSHPQSHLEIHQSGVLQKGQQLHAQLQQASLQLQQQKPALTPQAQQASHQNLLDQQLQLQLLQKQQLHHQQQQQQLHQQQQQQQQVISLVEPQSEPEQTKHHHSYMQNWQYQQHTSLPQQQVSGNSFTTSTLVQSPRHPVNYSRNKSPVVIRGNSGLVEGGDIPSCSTSPSTNNCHVSSSSKIPCTSQPGPATFVGSSVIDPATALLHDFQLRSDSRAKYEMNVHKGVEETKFRRNTPENLDATSSVTSYLLDTNGFQSNFALPTLCLDGDIHSNSRSNIPFTSAVDVLAPDALLSRGYESGKDIQNVLSNFGDDSRDIETELSAAGFGVPHLSFKPSCSNNAAIDEAGILNNGLWPNQTQCMRTYTKVQKRGSVGRTIDVTRYKGYDELSRDLARMFGLEGQLEDLQRSEWKLVYVDHENDILLVGDDPWEEFVSCVQSIKILSSAEVQQMSLDGNLPNLPFPNQACSGTDSGNAWKGHYDDNSEFFARQVS